MINRFRVISFLEGISFLLILGITMPLKYFFDTPGPNKIIGMAHGILFLLYIIGVFLVKSEKQWNIKTTAIVLLCSIIPFGTFWMDKKYLST